MRYFVFTVLPFGLFSASYIFTKCLKPLEKYWRIKGVNIALFLDDCWLTDIDRGACSILANNIWSDLRKAGFVRNDEKSQWCPSRIVEWLGIYGTPWMDRHSAPKSQAMATSGMAQLGVTTGVWGIVKYNMADSTKQRKVLDK